MIIFQSFRKRNIGFYSWMTRCKRSLCRVCNWGVYTRVLDDVLKHVIMFTFLIMTMMMQKISTGNPCVVDSHMIRDVDLSWSTEENPSCFFHALGLQPLPLPALNSDPKASWEAINSASSVTQTLSGEVADGQLNPLVTLLTNGPLGGLHEKVVDSVLLQRECVKCVDADDSAEFGDTPQLAEQVTELLPTQI
ncbi:hypothetical protein ACFXTN_006003 [Malus domestica]